MKSSYFLYPCAQLCVCPSPEGTTRTFNTYRVEADNQHGGEHHPLGRESPLPVHVTGSVVQADASLWPVICRTTAVLHPTLRTVVVSFDEYLKTILFCRSKKVNFSVHYLIRLLLYGMEFHSAPG